MNRVYRIRFGGEAYRMVYRVDDRKRKVAIVRLRPRATAYKGFPTP